MRLALFRCQTFQQWSAATCLPQQEPRLKRYPFLTTSRSFWRDILHWPRSPLATAVCDSRFARTSSGFAQSTSGIPLTGHRCHRSSIRDAARSTVTERSGSRGWIATGDTVVASAVRLYDHARSSLADDIRSLRVFYDRPAQRTAAGEHIDVDAPCAEQIRGAAVYSGAVWVRPDYRRLGFSKFIPRLARGFALARWQPSIFWGTIKPELDQAGLTQAYGSWQIGGRLAIRMPSWRKDFDLLFLWMDRATLVNDIATAIAQATTDNSRRSETLMTNISDP